MYDKDTDPITNAVLTLQAAGWTVTDGDGDTVTMTHPDADDEVVLAFA